MSITAGKLQIVKFNLFCYTFTIEVKLIRKLVQLFHSKLTQPIFGEMFSLNSLTLLFASFLAFLLLLFQLSHSCCRYFNITQNRSDKFGICTCFHQFFLSLCCLLHMAKQVHRHFGSCKKRGIIISALQEHNAKGSYRCGA